MKSLIRELLLDFVIIANFDFFFTDGQNLPSLDAPCFRKMIENDQIYVDKSKFLLFMLEEEPPRKFFFLSRPRRFGKSLLVDIMNEFFNGEKELFENTFIHKERPDYSWFSYPVVRLDFSGISSRTMEEFEAGIVGLLTDIGESYNIHCINENMSLEKALNKLIEELKEKYGKPVVMLIDEYDLPYTSSYTDEIEGPKILRALQSFFKVLKAQNTNIHFCFFTGVSRIAISDFFTTTTALDISMKPEYATIVGFTEKELERYFDTEIQNVANFHGKDKQAIYEEMKLWHYGFQFSGTGERVYNPCSVISYLSSKGDEINFWSKSGGLSSILRKKFEESPRLTYNYIRDYATSNIDPGNLKQPQFRVPKSILSGNVDLASTSIQMLQALLFQGGYLSIDRQIHVEGENASDYILRFSNLEVEVDYIKRLSRVILEGETREFQERIKNLRTTLGTHEWETFIGYLRTIFAQTPYFLYADKKMNKAMFQFHLYITMYQAGLHPNIEVLISKGRADLTAATVTTKYIFEIKLTENKENPLDQCREKYLLNSKQKFVCIGLQFSQKADIVDWGMALFSNTGELLEEHGPIKLSKSA